MDRTLILSPTETAQETFPQYFSGARVNIRMFGSSEASSFPRLIIYQEHKVISFSPYLDHVVNQFLVVNDCWQIVAFPYKLFSIKRVLLGGCIVRSLRGYWLLEIMKLNLVERLNYWIMEQVSVFCISVYLCKDVNQLWRLIKLIELNKNFFIVILNLI